MSARDPIPAAAPEDEFGVARRVANGDRAAFERLMRRHNRQLYRLARAFLRDDSEAKDALQDAYIGAYRAIGTFRGESSLSTWLSRLVLNECALRRRRSDRRRNIIPITGSDTGMTQAERVADSGERPDHAAARTQMRRILEAKVAGLPEALRVVFVMRSVEELSVAETADALGVTPETVRVRHFRAKGLLREALARDIDMAQGDIFQFGGAHCDQVVAAVLARLPSPAPPSPI